MSTNPMVEIEVAYDDGALIVRRLLLDGSHSIETVLTPDHPAFQDQDVENLTSLRDFYVSLADDRLSEVLDAINARVTGSSSRTWWKPTTWRAS